MVVDMRGRHIKFKGTGCYRKWSMNGERQHCRQSFQYGGYYYNSNFKKMCDFRLSQ